MLQWDRVKKRLLIVFIFLSFFFLRLWHLPQSLDFGSDQGLQLLESYKLYQSKKLSLIGPYSSFSVGGRYFFFGPAPYYVPMPFLTATGWNPLAVSYLMIILQFIAMVLVCFSLLKYRRSFSSAVYFMFLYTFLPIIVNYSRFHWNPNYLLPVAGILLALILRATVYKKSLLTFFVIGIFSGFGMQFHYSFALAIIFIIIWFVYYRLLSVRAFIILTLGFALGFIPIILFELRHNFYNTRTIIAYLTSKNTGSSGFSWQEYYILCLMPFLVYLATGVLVRLRKIHTVMVSAILSLLAVYSLYTFLPVPDHGFLMTDGWNYPSILKMGKIIQSQNPKHFNIVDVLTGDTRAMALRYILTINGLPPAAETDYAGMAELYVYSRTPIDTIIKGSLWEIDASEPLQVKESWNIGNGVTLYLLEHRSPDPVSEYLNPVVLQYSA